MQTTAGQGSELVGQLIAVGDADVRVKSVSSFTTLDNSGKKVTPKGIFLVVVLEIANVGKKPEVLTFVKLQDGKKREFDTTSDYDAVAALSSKKEFHSDITINPGFVGMDVKLYDVPTDATGFTLAADDYLGKTDRKPSADSFANSGGKGPDSGAGPELVGKTLADKDKVTVTVTKVDRVATLGSGSDSATAKGIYMVVVYTIKNDGDKPASYQTFDLKDADGRIYSTGDFDATLAASFSGAYKSDISVNPGQSGVGYKVFDVVKEATGFDLEAGS